MPRVACGDVGSIPARADDALIASTALVQWVEENTADILLIFKY